MNPAHLPLTIMSLNARSTWTAVERGTGRAVVFLHGYPLRHDMWGPQLEDLSTDFRVALLDLPGYGLAHDWPVPETLSGFAESVHESLIQNVGGPSVVVGHSFGGYIALELFRNHPADFAGLVLTNTRSEPDTPETREKRLATVRRLGDPSQSLDAEATARTLVAPSTWQSGSPVVEQVRAMIQAASSRTVIATLKAIAARPDLTPVLPGIRVPTLVIWGDQDQLIPPSQTQSMVSRIPGSSGAGIPAAGHLPSLEAPEPFDRVLETYLRQLPE
jgi:pimeloyl-ACP methyl ester carboxylesterase